MLYNIYTYVLMMLIQAFFRLTNIQFILLVLIYIRTVQNGEKVVLQDVKTAPLQPEILSNSASPPSQPQSISPPTQKKEPIIDTSHHEERLFTTAEEDQIANVTNSCAHIIADLQDLEIEQQEEIDKEKEEFELIQDEVDQVASK